MTQNEWNAMSGKEQAEYILNGKLVVHTRTGIRADAVVGSDNMTVTHHMVEAGKVQISNWHENPADALREAAETLDNYAKDLV